MTREGLIEAMARAIREMRDRPHSSYADEARAALAVLEAHAAVVPREPTREMLQAMCDRRGIDGSKAPTDILDNAAIISMGESVADYRAMLSASPFAQEAGTDVEAEAAKSRAAFERAVAQIGKRAGGER